MENSITVKKLPNGIYVPELCEIFRCFGDILSATIHYDAQKQRTGEAYIEFDSKHGALKAASVRNIKCRDRSLHVSLSVENTHFKQVFVKNFSPNWDECDLLEVFGDIGAVKTVKISEENGKSNGYGFVVFENHSTAKRAIESINGKVFNGRELRVERFKSKSERTDLMENSIEQVEKRLQQSIQKNNLHVKNLPADMSEDEFKKLFAKYGEIISAKIAADENGFSKEFGFVSFKKEEDAEKAQKRMNNYTLRNKTFKVNFKEDGRLRKQYNALKSKETDVKLRQYRQRAKSVPKFMPHCLNFREQFNNF